MTITTKRPIERCWGCGRRLPDGVTIWIRAYDSRHDGPIPADSWPIVSYAACCFPRIRRLERRKRAGGRR